MLVKGVAQAVVMRAKNRGRNKLCVRESIMVQEEDVR